MTARTTIAIRWHPGRGEYEYTSGSTVEGFDVECGMFNRLAAETAIEAAMQHDGFPAAVNVTITDYPFRVAVSMPQTPDMEIVVDGNTDYPRANFRAWNVPGMAGFMFPIAEAVAGFWHDWNEG